MDTSIFISNLLNNYIKPYNKSLNKIDNLNSLGKGNKNRKKRFQSNETTTKNKTLPFEIRLKAFYENIYLSRIIKGDTKFAYLLLSFMFIYRSTLNSLFRLLFNDKQMTQIVKPFDEALEFYEFTYLSPSKIANSCAICLYQYLTHFSNINDEEKIAKIIRDTILEHFPNHAHVNLRTDNFKKEIYCAGIYNGMPIFQWHTSSIKDSYYSHKDITRFYRYTKKAFNSIGYIQYIFIAIFLKNHEDKNLLKSKKGLQKIIQNLPLTYIKSYMKELEYQEEKNRPKSVKYYLSTPLRLLSTIFARYITKLALN